MVWTLQVHLAKYTKFQNDCSSRSQVQVWQLHNAYIKVSLLPEKAQMSSWQGSPLQDQAEASSHLPQPPAALEFQLPL